MPFVPLNLRPGIDRSSTDYSNEGGYYACDKVRFRTGKPQKIGGWVKYLNQAFLGTCRGLFNWTTNSGTNVLAVATNIKYYLESTGSLYDITPLRVTNTLTPAPFSVQAGSNTVIVTHNNHGAASGDYVTYSGATGFAGLDAAMLNAEFQVTYIDANTYSITTPLAANTTTSGGGTPNAAYQITTTPNIVMPGRGWGAGTWGRGAWGSAADSTTFTTLRLWSQEQFGEDHVFCPRNGPIYYWKASSGLTARAVPLASMPGAVDVPLMATDLLLSPGDRHLIAFGVNPIGSVEQDPLLIRWADTESNVNWQNLPTNAAGELRCSAGSYIVKAVQLKTEMLVFTDSYLHSMQFIGGNLIFGIKKVGDTISVASPKAMAVVNNTVYWMGNNKFYTYNGRPDTLPCTLLDYIFTDINATQSDQIHCGTNEAFNEVWWHYCSAKSSVIDRYVIYNYVDKVWYYGTLDRTAWLYSSLKKFPIAAANGYLYRHEAGNDDDRTRPINAWIETSDFDLDTGEHYSYVDRMLPDVTFVGSSSDTPSMMITITPRAAPGAKVQRGSAKPVASSKQIPVEEYTPEVGVRVRGRQIKMRFESTDLGVQWQLGTPRLDMRPDGMK